MCTHTHADTHTRVLPHQDSNYCSHTSTQSDRTLHAAHKAPPLASAEASAPSDSGECPEGPGDHMGTASPPSQHGSKGQGALRHGPGLHVTRGAGAAEGSRLSRTGARHGHVQPTEEGTSKSTRARELKQRRRRPPRTRARAPSRRLQQGTGAGPSREAPGTGPHRERALAASAPRKERFGPWARRRPGGRAAQDLPGGAAVRRAVQVAEQLQAVRSAGRVVGGLMAARLRLLRHLPHGCAGQDLAVQGCATEGGVSRAHAWPRGGQPLPGPPHPAPSLPGTPAPCPLPGPPGTPLHSAGRGGAEGQGPGVSRQKHTASAKPAFSGCKTISLFQKKITFLQTDFLLLFLKSSSKTRAQVTSGEGAQ